nr:MAG TPA: hypothetical protein [Caudoviricetes sp.]
MTLYIVVSRRPDFILPQRYHICRKYHMKMW